MTSNVRVNHFLNDFRLIDKALYLIFLFGVPSEMSNWWQIKLSPSKIMKEIKRCVYNRVVKEQLSIISKN